MEQVQLHNFVEEISASRFPHRNLFSPNPRMLTSDSSAHTHTVHQRASSIGVKLDWLFPRRKKTNGPTKKGNMEYTISKRGNTKVVIDGYEYVRERVIRDRTYWQCMFKGFCKARVHTVADVIVKVVNEHTHAPHQRRPKGRRRRNSGGKLLRDPSSSVAEVSGASPSEVSLSIAKVESLQVDVSPPSEDLAGTYISGQDDSVSDFAGSDVQEQNQITITGDVGSYSTGYYPIASQAESTELPPSASSASTDYFSSEPPSKFPRLSGTSQDKRDCSCLCKTIESVMEQHKNFISGMIENERKRQEARIEMILDLEARLRKEHEEFQLSVINMMNTGFSQILGVLTQNGTAMS